MTMETLLSQYMPSENAVKNVGELFAVFSHETRIRILIMLSVSELNVNDISRALQLNQSTISHQLRILKDRKIVTSTRKGKEKYYAIANDYINEVLFSAVKATAENEKSLSEKVTEQQLFNELSFNLG